jgi:sugar phosphate isomerase/epimerase
MRAFRWGLCIVVAVIVSVATVAPAVAAPKGDPQRDCAGRGVPVSQISIQLWTFAEYIGFGTDPATIARTEEVFQALREMGYRNVEPFTLSGLTAEQYRALLRKYGLRARSRHVNVGTPTEPVDFQQILEENRTIGIRFFGSGGTPQYTTEAEWIAYAEYLNELGRQARRAGQRLMVHNHNWEFETVFGDRSAFDILVEHTDRRNVVFQVDLHWATRGLGVAAGVTSVDAADDLTADLVERLRNRVQLFHVKDMATGTFPGRIEILGEGGIDFPEIFDEAERHIRYYVVEHDPRFGDPTFDPFEAAEKGFDYLDCVKF